MGVRWRSTTVDVERLQAPLSALSPAGRHDRLRWFCVSGGHLLGLDLDEGSTFFDLELPQPLADDLELEASPSGRFVAVVPSYGLQGVLVDTHTRETRALTRDDYHADVSTWAIAFVTSAGREVLIHATAWNRLEAHELPSFNRLAPDDDETSVDYFWGSTFTSPGGKRVASFGWCWHPIGIVQTFDVAEWLSSRTESPPQLPLNLQADWWDAQLCWLDDERLALFGTNIEDDDGYMGDQRGVLIVDAQGKKLHYFDGLLGRQLASDGARLYVSSDTHTHVVDLATMELTRDAGPHFTDWHPGARCFLTRPTPEAPRRFTLTRLVGELADAGLEPGATVTPAALAVLADALEERALAPKAVAHLRSGEPHGASHCWVVEALRRS